MLFLLGVGLLILCAGTFFSLTASAGLVPTIAGLAICLAVATLMFWLAIAQGKSFVITDNNGLEFKVPLYGRRVIWTQIDIDRIETLTLSRESPWHLRWRTNGVGVPGYRLGWFRTRNKHKVLAAVTHEQVVVIPTHDGFALMASVQSPVALVNDIRKRRQ